MPLDCTKPRFQPRQCNISVGQPQHEVRRFRYVSNFCTKSRVQQGSEPQLSTITRSLLFSIAHNALTNVFRHSGAGGVTILLEFKSEGLRMSVSDDGIGLPEDYARRGHGFRNMAAEAERLRGTLSVQSNQDGTTVSCTVPYQRKERGV